MDLYSRIIRHLKEEYKKGATYRELAERYNSSYTHIYNIMHEKSSISGISLDFFLRLFPNCRIDLEGKTLAPHTTSITNHNNGNVVGINNGVITADCMAAVLNKILESDKLSDSEKIKVIKVLQK